MSGTTGSDAGAASVLSFEEEPSVTKIERRGIEYVPPDSRWGRPSSLFWMWAGAVWNVEFVVYGGLAVVVFGLSFAQAVVIILVGNLFYLLTGLASLQGPQAGTTTFAISRAPFGPNGNRMPSFFNWVTQVGFEIEGIALIVLAAIALTSKAGFTAGTAGEGHLHHRRGGDPGGAARCSATPRCCRVLRVARHPVRRPVRGHGDPHDVQGQAARRAARRGLGLAAGLPGPGDLRGRPGLDRERQRLLALPAADSRPAAASCSPSRWAAPSRPRCWRSSAPRSRPGCPARRTITGLTAGFPGWFVVPYLIFAIVQLFAINTLDLYSSGVTLQSLVPGLQAAAVRGASTRWSAARSPPTRSSRRRFFIAADRLPAVHHRLAGPVVRDLPGGLAGCAGTATTTRRC